MSRSSEPRRRPPGGGEDPLLQQMTIRARQAYVIVKQQTCPPSEPFVDRHVPSWDGGTDSNGTTHTNVWPRVAAFFLEHGIDPLMYFRAQMTSGRLYGPRQLINEQSLERYHNFKHAEAEACKVKLDCEAAVFNRGVDTLRSIYPTEPREKLWMFTLLNESLNMSPLFRYCMARQLAMPRVAERYFDGARCQYLTLWEAYKQHWQGLLPQDFVAEVDRQRQMSGGR